jgi:hypothetical protein
MNNRNALLFEFGHKIARVVTRSFDDLDATLKDDLNVFVIGRCPNARYPQPDLGTFSGASNTRQLGNDDGDDGGKDPWHHCVTGSST